MFSCGVIVFPYLVQARDSTSYAPATMEVQSSIPTGTVATWPLDAAVPSGWLACDGQAVPGMYKQLRALMARVPNYNSQQFLRGSTSGAGRTVADSTRSHTHGQPSHSHGFSMALSNTTVSGSAAAQRFQDRHTGASGYPSHIDPWHGGRGRVQTIVGSADFIPGEGGGTLYTYPIYLVEDATYHSTEGPSSVNARVVNGTVSGTIYQSGGDETYATGGAETAPKHTLVKFIIKHD